MNFLGVETHCVPHQLTNLQANLVVHIKLSNVLVVSRVLLVVNGRQSVQSTSNLEDMTHFILEKLLSSAVMVEAEIG